MNLLICILKLNTLALPKQHLKIGESPKSSSTRVLNILGIFAWKIEEEVIFFHFFYFLVIKN